MAITTNGRRDWVHSWIGLVLGLLLAIEAAAGALLTLRSLGSEPSDFLQTSNSDIGERSKALDRAHLALRKSYPNIDGYWRFRWPEAATATVLAETVVPGPENGEPLRMQVEVDPTTGATRELPTGAWGQPGTLERLHAELAFGAVGSVLVAVIGLAATALLVTGHLRIFEEMRRRRAAYGVIPSAHRLLGLCIGPMLGVCVVSGVALALHAPFDATADNAPRVSRYVRSTAAPVTGDIGIAAAVAIARGLRPKLPVQSVTTPDGSHGSYCVSFGALGSHPHAPLRVWVDRNSGQIKDLDHAAHPTEESTGLHDWLVQLHGGGNFGALGRMLWAAVGLVPLLLWVSGSLLWISRRWSGLRSPAGSPDRPDGQRVADLARRLLGRLLSMAGQLQGAFGRAGRR